MVDNRDLETRVGLSADRWARAPVDIVIWTTTAWTLPANQAVALGAEIRYVLVEDQWPATARIGWSLAAELLDECLERDGHATDAADR